jgi:4a-hydroxytetrahydrobiopterin dehydratase
MARQALSDDQIAGHLAKLPGWERDGMAIKRMYALDSYLAGVALASAIGTICEGINHHPDILIGYKKVTVSFTTHDAGFMLTEADFKAAEAVNMLPYPRAK